MTQTTGIHIDLKLMQQGFYFDVQATLAAQGITVIFGASGSGKTTLLRCIAGLTKADGVIRVGQQLWQNSTQGVFTPTWQRKVGYVFQESSLFEHLSIAQNVRYGLQRLPIHQHGEAQRRLTELTALLDIAHLNNKAVNQLSGGERQRVAIVRAMASLPQLLLLDEPLAAIDGARRAQFLSWLRQLSRQYALPIIYVTHSLEELLALADDVLLLERGRVQLHQPLLAAKQAAPLRQKIIDAAAQYQGHV